MTNHVRLITSILFVSQITFAQSKHSDYSNQKFSADTVKHTIYALTKELRLKHPGFYRYNSVANFNSYIDSINSTIKDSLNELEVYRKLKPIIAKIGCLHTGLSLPQEYKNYLNGLPNLFPCKLFFADHKAYVVKNYSTVKEISPGDEIVSINGQGMDKIIDQLFDFIPSDGYNVTMKYRALNLQFPLWYRSIALTEDFSIVVKQNNIEKTYQIKGEKYSDISADGFLKEPIESKQLEFKLDTGFAVLT
ncbi:MAG TPA: hypothetical protein VGO21_00460, partial [Candidatus Paceibacterota bacterium]|nr:hypothetical protein [Candidatus Paceibacterota bacterium]